MSIEADGHLKRVACQLFTQLPEDKREALTVLRYVRQLIFCLGQEWETVSQSDVRLFEQPARTDREASVPRLRVVQPAHPDTTSRE